MSFLDRMKDGITSIIPSSKPGLRSSMSGIGSNSGHGMVPFDDDMIVPKRTIIFHAAQIFFNFLAMACFASIAAFQAKWKIGPSGLSGFAIFISIAGILLSTFMLFVPVAYEKYDKLVRLARALKEVRVGFILNGFGTGFALMISFIVTISVFTEPGCKDVEKDPHADLGDEFKKELPGWCSTKKAAAVFFWLAFAFWLVSVVFLVLDWRSGKLHAPRDPPFAHPNEPSELGDAEDDEESSYHHVEAPVRRQTGGDANTNADSPFADSYRYNGAASYNAPQASRPSIDAYGAFSDPVPASYNSAQPENHYAASSQSPPQLPEISGLGGGGDNVPRVSRTMQYADPYAAVRASIATPPGPSSTPPGYEPYPGYNR